jgi:hypothetical protein
MCEPTDDGFGSSSSDDDDDDDDDDDQEYDDEDNDASGWQRSKSRQYGGGSEAPAPAPAPALAPAARPVEEQPPPVQSLGLVPAEGDDEFDSAPTAWEHQRDEATGITVRVLFRSVGTTAGSRALCLFFVADTLRVGGVRWLCSIRSTQRQERRLLQARATKRTTRGDTLCSGKLAETNA